MNDPKKQDTPEAANDAPNDAAAEAAEVAEADAKAAMAAQEALEAAGLDEDRDPEELSEEELVERVQELETELEEARDQRMRAVAEAENTRRRLQKERDDALKFATKGFATDMLTVADNLTRALEAIPADALKEDPALKALADGVKLTEAEMFRFFEKHGVTRIDPLGDRLDPNLHQAMMQVDNTDAPDGTIVQVLAPGYMLHDRLLRAAMVAVAKGGAKAAPKPAPKPEGEPPVNGEGGAPDSGDPEAGDKVDTTA